MRPTTHKPDELELDLPALDGDESGADSSPEYDGAEELTADAGGDALDDATAEDTPLDDLAFDGVETGWLDDAESAATLDVGSFDLDLGPEAERKVLEDDEADAREGLEELFADETSVAADEGEEGPLAADEELREEDLPALDADDDGDVADEDLFDGQILGGDHDLRWDDRAWARVSDLADRAASDEVDDSGVLTAPGDDPAQRARDATWKVLEGGGRVMASGPLPGGSVVVAVASSDRSRAILVRIQTNGQARIIAEIEPRIAAGEDDGEACVVTFVRWDAGCGCLFVGGSFGVEAYRPA